jgi:hypothetical protein
MSAISSRRRSSVIEIQHENGEMYYFDDPDLGGTGETSWDKEELEARRFTKDTKYWWYKDEEGDSIGPNPGGHLLYWLKEGHVSHETLVSSDNTTWKTITEVKDSIEDWTESDDDEDKETDHWWYKDEEGDIIGPNPVGHLLYWLKEGHVSHETLVSSDNTTWKTITEVKGSIEDWTESDDDENKDTDKKTQEENKLADTGKEKGPTKEEKGTTKDGITDELKDEIKDIMTDIKKKQGNNAFRQRAGRRRSVFLQTEISRVMDNDKPILSQDLELMIPIVPCGEESELRQKWVIPKRICDEAGNGPDELVFTNETEMRSPDGKKVTSKIHSNGTKLTIISNIRVYEYADGVKIQINEAENTTIKRDPSGFMEQITTSTNVRVTQNSSGFRCQENADGSILRIHPNGHRLTIYKNGISLFVIPKPLQKIQYNPDGTKILQLPERKTMVQWLVDGSSIVTCATTGRKTQKMKDGTIMVRNEQDGSVCQIGADGTQIVVQKDGSRFEKRPDGSTVERKNNGTVTQSMPDGIIVRVFQDGKREQYNKDGTKLTMNIDGTMIQEEADGTTIERKPNGDVKQTNSDGTVTESFAIL